ncbi:ABC-type transport system permease protein (probable substrate branched-chain amino acids) [Natronomonas pharaonis DSM 2160]|uniref:ABC-type transport system permease protein (Probable substrate branched-chain amino acids) n=1 Tax=Natronomonas pharaonis (strain ATCC 35678 / DSM 2160 / CIP 103997 / JCM 8858 / NBRC 14720 / NCIMB 2260 / Gabara) TaxID=348780 RepID=A0A1U7ETE7_NATPD|nr:branched-chain amino acid ABC transporter permease [Natronomonas pharaonis]CAI48176.1 ABC-type transport system permease protein (probable substrate branched-chain amino acids) [Natronomonas pharaonis DSM 2160]
MSNDDSRQFRIMKGLELSTRQLLYIGIAVAVLLAVPDIEQFHADLRMQTIYLGLCWGLAALGVNLLLRHTELVSFGHAAYFGGGAYGAALVAQYAGIEEAVLLVLAGVLVAISLAVVIGWLVAGYLDIYFALLTLAFNQLLFAIVMGSPRLLGSDDGLSVRPASELTRPTLFGVEFTAAQYEVLIYYVAIAVLIVMLLVTWRLINSPFGRALDAIGQDRTRARFIGIPVKRYVWVTFVISAVYGGLAGGLYSLSMLHVRPGNTLFVLRSGEILFMAILGGFKTLLGPIAGGIVLTYMLTELRFATEYWEFATGFVLLLVVFLLPRGILGSWPTIAAGFSKRVSNPGLLSDDIGVLASMIAAKLRDAAHTTKIILFGVK